MQPDLLAWRPEHKARATDPETSHMAARQAKSLAGEHYTLILAALRGGPATAEEIADRCGLQTHQCNRRVGELIESDLVIETGETRRNRAGRQMRVVRRV